MAKSKTSLKTAKKSVVIPDPKNVKVGITFDELADGEYFIMDGEIWQKSDDTFTCQGAQAVLDGEQKDDLCEEIVIPVIVTIAWEVK